MSDDLTKPCTGPCGERKPLSAFARNQHNRDGREGACKECRNRRDRQHRAEMALERAAMESGGLDGETSSEVNVASPVVIVVPVCNCTVRAICRHCDGLMVRVGDGYWCRFCRLRKVMYLETHDPNCTGMPLFNRLVPAFAQKKDAETKYHGMRYGY